MTADAVARLSAGGPARRIRNIEHGECTAGWSAELVSWGQCVHVGVTHIHAELSSPNNNSPLIPASLSPATSDTMSEPLSTNSEAPAAAAACKESKAQLNSKSTRWLTSAALQHDQSYCLGWCKSSQDARK